MSRPSGGAALWNATLALFSALETAVDLDPAIDIDVCDALAAGLDHSLANGLVLETQCENAIACVLELSNHADPQQGEDSEKNFANSASWGSQSPRIEAA